MDKLPIASIVSIIVMLISGIESKAKYPKPIRFLVRIIIVLLFVISIYTLLFYGVFAVEESLNKRVISGILGLFIIAFLVNWVKDRVDIRE